MRTVDVAASRARVWEIVSDYEGAPAWMPVREVVRRRRGTPHPDGVGALRTVRGSGLVVEEEIVAFEAGRRLAWRLMRGAPVRDHEGEIALEGVPCGTRVHWRVRFRARIPGTGPLLAVALSRAVDASLSGLRALAETGAPATGRGKLRRAGSDPSVRESMAEPTVVPDIPSLKNFVGQQLGTSDWVEVTQEQIDAFAGATGDRQWIHVDVERARRESPFGSTIAHGYLTLSLAPVLLPQIVRVNGVRLGVNYGVEKMRLPAPVPAGSRVRVKAELKDVRDMPGGGARATYALAFEVEGGSKPACVADVIFVYYP